MLKKKGNDSDQFKKETVQKKAKQSQLVIYVLQLQMGRWYVGKTTKSRLQERINQHRTHGGRCAQWVKIFGFKREAKQFYKYDNVSPFDEDRVVKELMHLKGLNKVRGGSYARTMDLSKEQTEFIIRQIQGASNCCYKCGQKGHFIMKCPKLLNNRQQPPKRNHRGQFQNSKKDKYWFVPKCNKCKQYGHYQEQCDFDSFQSTRRDNYLKNVRCYNCGKYGHFAYDCQEEDAQYYEYEYGFESEYDQSSDRSIQQDQQNYRPRQQYQYKKRNQYLEKVRCYKCGHYGHYSNNCQQQSEENSHSEFDQSASNGYSDYS